MDLQGKDMVETAEAEEIVELRKQLLQEYRQIKDNMAKINDLIVLFNTDVLPPLAERLRDLEPKFTTVHSVFELAVLLHSLLPRPHNHPISEFRLYCTRFNKNMTSTTTTTSTKEKIVLIGSGNWGSVIAKIIGENVLTQERSKLFERTINMWVYEEQVEGRNLTDIINERHENVKYLPGVRLPENIVAEPDLLKAAKDATILIFVVPHQFITRICGQLAAAGLNPRAKAISLIKGVDFSNNKLQLVSELISECLKIDVSVLMGANVAAEVATGAFCETTIGARSKENGEIFKLLFQTPTFLVNVVNDVAGVELCGALKNVIALGAGFVDGMGLGSNTKAAVIRIGVAEMKKFAETFYQGILVDTFFESCGIADVITTCYSGRNRKVAEAMIKTGRSCEDLEKEMLNGQKLQGPITAKEIYDILASRNLLKEFPMFVRIYRICFEGKPASSLLEGW